MTLAQSSNSAHRSSGSARSSPDGHPYHNANDDTANMSISGPEEASPLMPISRDAEAAIVPERQVQNACTQTINHGNSLDILVQMAHLRSASPSPSTKLSAQIRIKDLVQQLRHEKYLRERVQILKHRKRILHQTISLSARLHRLQAMVRDSLIEISTRRDAAIPFKKLLQHTADLVDVCYSRWNLQLHALDPLETSDYLPIPSEALQSGRPELSIPLQSDLLLLLNFLRHNPTYIVRRIKAMSPTQVQGLSTVPRLQPVGKSALFSMSATTRKANHQRLQDQSKTLQEYTISFERSNPWSLLLFNVYGTDTSLHDPENLLRISTWSTVLADLFVTSRPWADALAPMLFESFASIHDWHIRESVQLQLMDILQQGAFLLSPVSDDLGPIQGFTNPSETPEARALFSNAAVDLLLLFSENRGGFPPGALQFMSAVLAKLTKEQLQSEFRGICLNWFFERFLSLAIVYPENENMLLNFHVSSTARDQILKPLYRGVGQTFDAFCAGHLLQPEAPLAHHAISCIINTLEAEHVDNVYSVLDRRTAGSVKDLSVSICLSEVVRLLDALSPQVMHSAPPDRNHKNFLESSKQSFQAQFSLDPFNQLRQELLNLQEPGTSVKGLHPCDEQWMEFRINQSGQLSFCADVADQKAPSSETHNFEPDLVQQASLRLCSTSMSTPHQSEGSSNYRSDRKPRDSLKKMFRDMIDSQDARTDPRAHLFWESAGALLSTKYPKCDLTGDESPILRPLVLKSKSRQSFHVSECAVLEADISGLEDISSKIRCAITTSVDRLEDLKVKLWYATYVMTSKSYEDAKNISEALMNMALLTPLKDSPARPATLSSTRPTSSRSSTSSAWKQPVNATLGALKARVEHGGPMKLSDEQIQITESWLREMVVENFCTGEERIHRFCMEISSTSRAIISESGDRTASPVLWCNVLFSDEEAYYNLNAMGVSSAPASTRPASVSSEPYATSLSSARPLGRNVHPVRSSIQEERLSAVRRLSGQGSWSARFDRDVPHTDPFFAVGSPGPTYSVTTAESISTFWSPRPSNPRSMTSASVYSRPASMYNEGNNNRFAETVHGKSEDLNKLRHKLVCLLLSDLGCIVWSRGSETDAWLHTVHDDEEVSRKLQQWHTIEGLVRDREQNPGIADRQRPKLQRRESLPIPHKLSSVAGMNDPPAPSEDASEHDLKFEIALANLLSKMKSHVDPKKKLQAVQDFHDISVKQIQMASEKKRNVRHNLDTNLSRRRRSLDTALHTSRVHSDEIMCMANTNVAELPTDAQIISQLKSNLTALKPLTLFRDLQYIAALVPQELSNRTPRGEAVIHLGLAALAYKDDVCRSMVAVADKLVSKDAVKRLQFIDPPETTIKRAAEFWMIAAREGNAVAQRELGLLYLSHPYSIQVLTYPLTTASEVFRPETQWSDQSEANASKSSLCLALHWVKLASENGDEVATKKLAEREASISIR